MKPKISEYQQKAIDFLKATKTTFKAKFFKHGRYFNDDNESRDIYKISLKNSKGSYTFTFGQSISNKKIIPNEYNVLACVQKYDPGTFEYFCSEFGYEASNETYTSVNRESMKIYKSVVNEW